MVVVVVVLQTCCYAGLRKPARGRLFEGGQWEFWGEVNSQEVSIAGRGIGEFEAIREGSLLFCLSLQIRVSSVNCGSFMSFAPQP